MRFMIIVKSCPEFEAEVQPDPDPAVMAAMATYHEELARAGVLLDGSGLQPSRTGWRIHYGPSGTDGLSSRHVVNGPFAEPRELIAGFTMIQVSSREEALEWSRRFPNPVREGAEAIVEVRQLYELEEFTPSETLEKFKAIEGLSKS
ncbi:YciI family protein [Aquabacterium sp. UBA2148]|uniref:YciI family protein n=1 Tax=Aquabacterium sp. UBA2148 TaxID=1946042 RepID=UPI002580062D|nr:YciI family protein [Aquabacterium sp. UBA2148]